ncbi:MAG TPA: zinc-binding alcohol dehydrogenase [Stellaceae bacterium]|jgi:2-desacetyl-2-hydroxyethyl bacteriochlorophyllide A dehydrogenase|nr:zinc-binding alcohol dehydrogenase [Stellaceae bacterium]
MSERGRAFWLVAPGRGEIREAALAAPTAEEVLIRAAASAISRGTESLVFLGRVPPSEYQTMRCPFQEGDFPAPVKYGYASIGTVEAGSAALRGQRVFCLYPHQDFYVVPADAVVPVPETVPDERAALAANMETALNAMWDAAPCLGDRIAVVGAGVVGCLIAALAAKIPGTRVELIDIDPRRAPNAAALGCGFAMPDAARGDCDIVFHTSASEAGLATTLRLAGFEAKLIELSWYGNKPVSVPLGDAFHQRRLQLISSQVGAVAPARRARRTHRERLALALTLLADPVYDRLITGHCTLDELPQRLAQLAAAPDGALAEIVRYR